MATITRTPYSAARERPGKTKAVADTGDVPAFFGLGSFRDNEAGQGVLILRLEDRDGTIHRVRLAGAEGVKLARFLRGSDTLRAEMAAAGMED